MYLNQTTSNLIYPLIVGDILILGIVCVIPACQDSISLLSRRGKVPVGVEKV